ncbi:MAG: PucR family transcriptional regulator [Aminipila sp.]
MKITIDDLIKLNKFQKMHLVTGKDGLYREVIDCGILDYELDQSLKGKYLYTNFHENQLVLTTFLYAKNNPFLISEAVKYLINKGASGLIIKNVFQLSIHDSILRYADAKSFPIFIIDEPSVYFEEIITDISDYIRDLARVDFGDQEISALLYQPFDGSEIKKGALRLNPCFHSQIIVMYLHQNTTMSSEQYTNLIEGYRNSPFRNYCHSLYRYRNGLMYIFSSENLSQENEHLRYDDWIKALVGDSSNYSIGVSDSHYTLAELKDALWEAVYAAIMNQDSKQLYTRYAELGTFQFILPLVDQKSMMNYSNRIIEPLLEFDVENKGNLLNTLLNYVKCDGDLHLLAEVMGQHENTLRYRFGQIEQVTGLNLKNNGHYEQLALAAKIYIVSEKILGF